MNLRYLRVPAFIVLAFSISSYAQSLGDVARQFREERQQSASSNPKVITNDDLVSPKPAPASRKSATQDVTQDATQNATQDEPAKEDEERAKDANSAGEAKSVKQDPAKKREEQELALAKRSQEINKTYLDRIAAIRTQISTAQQELAKFQMDQVESTNAFRRSVGTSPNVGTYEEEQRLLNDQIAARRDLINSLNSQLEDTQEAARHAGVPHASD